MSDTQEFTLRAMAENYSGGHQWDHLDSKACVKAADEIKELRANQEAPKQRKKASYVGVPAIFELTMACNVLIRAYGASIYHVGSSLQRPDWRDVDLVMILSDEAFEREFPNAPLHSAAWEHDPKWLVLTVSLSKWLTEKAGVPVDFKFQPRTFANERHDGPRNPIGRYINHRPPQEDE